MVVGINVDVITTRFRRIFTTATSSGEVALTMVSVIVLGASKDGVPER